MRNASSSRRVYAKCRTCAWPTVSRDCMRATYSASTCKLQSSKNSKNRPKSAKQDTPLCSRRHDAKDGIRHNQTVSENAMKTAKNERRCKHTSGNHTRRLYLSYPIYLSYLSVYPICLSVCLSIYLSIYHLSIIYLIYLYLLTKHFITMYYNVCTMRAGKAQITGTNSFSLYLSLHVQLQINKKYKTILYIAVFGVVH